MSVTPVSTTRFCQDSKRIKTKKIALTFDDGPYGEHPDADGNYTNFILSAIEQVNRKLSKAGKPPIRVTFFVQAKYIALNPATFNRIKQLGHEVGNHAWFHYDWSPKIGKMVSNEEAFEQMIKAHHEISKYYPNLFLFRPPGGYIRESLWQKIEAKFPQYRLAGWHNHPEKGKRNNQVIFDNNFEKRGPEGEAVYLLHEKMEGTIGKIERFFKRLYPQIENGEFSFVQASNIIRTNLWEGLTPFGN